MERDTFFRGLILNSRLYYYDIRERVVLNKMEASDKEKKAVVPWGGTLRYLHILVVEDITTNERAGRYVRFVEVGDGADGVPGGVGVPGEVGVPGGVRWRRLCLQNAERCCGSSGK